VDDSSPHDSLTKTALGEEACPAASRTSQVCVWNARMDGWIVNPGARQTTTGPRQPGTPERERFLSKPRASDNAPCRMAHTSPRTPSVPELISFDTLRFTCLRRPKAEAFPPGSKSLVRGEFGSTLCDQDLAKHTTPGAEDTSEIQVIVNDPYQTLAQAKREHLTTPHDPSFWVPWCARWRERGEMEREETSQNRFIQHGLSCTCRSQERPAQIRFCCQEQLRTLRSRTNCQLWSAGTRRRRRSRQCGNVPGQFTTDPFPVVQQGPSYERNMCRSL